MGNLQDFSINGYAITDSIYDNQEIGSILQQIELVSKEKETFRKSADLFAIRQFLKEVPELFEIIFNNKLKLILGQLFIHKYFVVKSIYFDKPPSSNWYVAYHQDLTISVDKKLDVTGFVSWTTKQNQFAVQPPLSFLQNIVTVRIHLDETNEHNGALKVVPRSQLKNIYRPENIDWTKESQVNCNVSKGGVMLMKPLLLHSSGRTTNDKQRRVIHIEFSDIELPKGLSWAERINL